MKITFRRDVLANYMVIENTEGFCADDFAVKMLERNDIRNLLKFDHEEINGKTDLLYDISSKQAMLIMFETEKLSCEILKKFVYSLKSLLDTLEEYLLDPNNIMLKKECIFTDLKTGAFSYCYNPYYNGDLKMELGIISDELLGFADYEDPKAVRLVYDLNKECHRENFTADALATLMAAEKADLSVKEGPPEKKEQLLKTEIKAPAPVCPDDAGKEEPSAGFLKKFSVYLKGRSVYDVVEDIDSGKIAAKIKESAPLKVSGNGYGSKEKVKSKKHAEKGNDLKAALPQDFYLQNKEGRDDLVLEEVKLDLSREEDLYSGETCLLKDQNECRRLVGMGHARGTVMEVDKFPYTIGKLKDRVDGISYSPAVSRMHCRIHESLLDDGGYFFEDLNSKNGSYINNIRVDPYKKMPLRPGDIIKIADEEYAFR